MWRVVDASPFCDGVGIAEFDAVFQGWALGFPLRRYCVRISSISFGVISVDTSIRMIFVLDFYGYQLIRLIHLML